MPSDPPPWREFTYPLNVFMHILAHEEGSVSWLHYGLFEHAGESLAAAQERSTALLLSRLPPPPARLLEVGIGLATTLRRLVSAGYDAQGITPDVQQIAMARARYGDTLRLDCSRFEDYGSAEAGLDLSRPAYDALVFQESAQYIDSQALFARAATLTALVIVLDEFALQPVAEEGALHSRDSFLAAAALNGFEVTEELDLTAKAAPTMAYFTDRIPAYRSRLVTDLGLTHQQIDDLVTSGARYRQRYADGTYGYRLVCLLRNASVSCGP